jgi:diguanylate cyclase (GGDEF)-like protein
MLASMTRMVENRLAVGWMGAVLFAAAYALFAAFALESTETALGIAVIWPSSGILVAGLLLLPPSQRPLLLVLVGAASLSVNMAFGASPGTACAFTLANLVEGFVTARMACVGGSGCGSFVNPNWVLRYTKAAVMGAASSSALATIASGNWSDMTFALSWFTTVLLGILIVAPIAITAVRVLTGSEKYEVGKWKTLGVAVFALVSVTATFSQSAYPLLYLPVIATVLATYVAGVAGSLAVVLAITVSGTLAVANGTSPIALVQGRVEEIYFFQFYLLTIFASSLPLASLLSKSRAQMKEIELRKAQHDAAQSFAHVGHWRYCLRTNTSEWSDGMFRIYGLDPETDRARNLEHGSIIPQDNADVRAVLERAVIDHQPFTLKARIETATGQIRHIESLGDVELEHGRPVAIFGVVKDVTEHALAMKDLAREKARAEALAKKAVLVSETDQLTEVANRRKLLGTLDKEIARAERDGTPLSIVMIDVDHFKAINDMHGHAAGDEVLREIARIGERELRKGDLFGRLGGEEFLAILPNTPGDIAVRVGERLRAKCHEQAWPQIEGLDTISISLGVAVHQTGADETFLLQAADTALYQSKNSGRNRLTLAA